MPTPTKGPRLGGGPAHERLLLANLATQLFEHDAITTTEAKAKRLRPLAERLVTHAKKDNLHARRQVLTVVRDKDVVYRLFSEIAPRYTNRPGGYTRITKLGPRKGDNAPMARIELVEGLTVAQEAVGEAEKARGSRFARRGGAASAEVPAAAAPAAEVVESEVVDTPAEVPADTATEVPAETATEAPVETAVEETPAAEVAADEVPADEPASQAEAASDSDPAEG